METELLGFYFVFVSDACAVQVTLPLQIQDSGKTSTCSGRFNCHYTGSVSSCGNVQLLVQRCVHRKCDQYIFLRHSIGKKKDMVR